MFACSRISHLSAYWPRGTALLSRGLQTLGRQPELAVGLALSAGFCLFTALQQESAYGARQQELARQTENLAVALEQTTVRTIAELDIVLRMLRRTRSSFSHTAEWSSIIDLAYDASDQIAQIGIMDAKGFVVTSTAMRIPLPGLNFADREHFKVHASDGTDKLFIGKPLLGRLSGKWSIQFSRPVYAADGSFDGVIVASLDQDKLTQAYKTLQLGTESGVAIVGRDNVIRTGSGVFSGIVAKGQALPSEFADKLMQPGTDTIQTSEFGVAHIVARRGLADYPLSVVVASKSNSRWEFFADQGWRYAALALIASLTILTLTVLLSRLRQQGIRQAEDHLRLQAEKQAAEAASASRQMFLAVMSHEIRTPMNGVLGILGLLMKSELSGKQKNLCKTAHESAVALLSILNDALDQTKLLAGNVELEKISFNLEEAAAECIALFQPRALEKSIKIAYWVDPALPAFVLGDQARLRQVLLNLVGNAIKFTQVGSVDLLVSSRSDPEGRPLVRFEIVDTGVGISSSNVGSLFKPFTQGDTSITRKFGGTGLGLSISKQLITLMGGHIAVDSEEGAGSRFWFEIDLPRSEPPVPYEAQGPSVLCQPEKQRENRSLRILVAEDNPVNQIVAEELLIGAGHRPMLVCNGEEAVDAALVETFDLILMDVQMPGMDGHSATQAIRNLASAARYLPIIALTANASKEDKEACLANGMDDVVTKPFSEELLFAAISKVLSQREYERSRPLEARVA